ncbi:unnamed protein product [Lactuca saligna]|uniref:Acyltransferase n=1 Tax=Lactuca saligna TaxID=75948 RepID=A0AA35W1D3_LACSI|nr:unnamed protein product [Lactuca saligna]
MTEETNGLRRPPLSSSAEPTPAEYTGKRGPPFLEFIAIMMWLGTLHFLAFLVVASFVLLPLSNFLMVIAMLLVLTFIPINDNCKWGLALARFIFKHVGGYFPATIYVEDIKAFDPDRAYVFGFEPHSVWPMGAGILANLTSFMPIKKVKILASSAVFRTPLIRHLWTWLKVSSVTKKNFISLLKNGCSCIVIPGGVQETFFMKHDYEVAFLKTRKGFIRLAMENDAPVVPVFAFGQSYVYKWAKPQGKFFLKLSRAIKFTPMIFWGAFWSFVPFRRPMLMVIGKPIHFKKNTTPTMEEVSVVHGQFLEALQSLFDRHKERAGYPNLELQII